jgi:hypothetical protein
MWTADNFIEIGPIGFLLHDHGWLVTWKRLIKIEATWPTYATFRLGRIPGFSSYDTKERTVATMALAIPK